MMTASPNLNTLPIRMAALISLSKSIPRNNLLDFQVCLLGTFLIVTAHSVHDLKDRLNELYTDDKVYNTIQVLYTIVNKHRFVSK